jgi:hypothetical protein
MPDVESDLSAIHRIDDPYREEGPRMLRLAYRLAHYQGCVRTAWLARQPAAAPPARSPQPPAPEHAPGVQWVPSTPQAIAASPLSRYVSITAVSADG